MSSILSENYSFNKAKKHAIYLYKICWSLYRFLYSRLFNKPLVHIIGDSHIFSFTQSKSFVIHPIGPATQRITLKRIKALQTQIKNCLP